MIAALAGGGGVGWAAPAEGTLLVDEPFTGASADDRFSGYGSACLTGAPAVTGLGAALHPLGGCASAVGPVPPAGGAPFGFLRLTDDLNDASGAVLFDQALPADEGIEVTFDQYQYGSTTPATPADGISFFLVDGAGGLSAPGAFGGSLGYGKKLPDDNPANQFLPGVDNGYLGVGFDVLGNYFGDWERRGQGCARQSPAGTPFRIPGPGQNMVTVRGPGNGITGYCFLTATTSNFTTTGPWPSTLPGRLQGPLTAFPPGTNAEQAAQLLQPSRRTVTIQISPGPAPHVTIDIDFNDGAGSQRVLEFDAPTPVPDTYKFGFGASTGLFTDVHLIGNVRVRSMQPLSLLDLTKSADTGHAYREGDTVEYTYTVTNVTGVPVPDIEVADDRVARVVCASTSLAPAGQPGDSTTCTGTYTVTAEDVLAGAVTNTATATGDAGRVVSPERSVTAATEPTPSPSASPAASVPPSVSPTPSGPALANTGTRLSPTIFVGAAAVLAGIITLLLSRMAGARRAGKRRGRPLAG
ncbi:DUF7507 domain-containing protein [Hamadaea tsunoensis]|uniref:DUF7507 domain-containing protein n=1 Tax=Hamadaea tsunoensis TaxID=53368 RepID=UPI0003F81BEE|nr:hypothetical protein [Hamadaea tsunoensis]